MVILCSKENYIFEISTLKDCSDKYYKYLISEISACLKKYKNFKVGPVLESLQAERGAIFEKTRIWTGTDYIELQEFYDQVWSTVYHYALGFCFTFDLSKVKKYEFVIYQGNTRPGIEFIIADTNPYGPMRIMIHTKNDLPDADVLNGQIRSVISKNDNLVHKGEIGKKTSKREPTRKIPCVQYEFKTCQNIEDNRIVFDRFNCHIPFLYNGQHLDHLIPQAIPNCSDEVTKEAFDLIASKISNCSRTQTCETTRFSSTYSSAVGLLTQISLPTCFILSHSVLTRLSSRTVPSREVPGRSRDRTGPRDLEGPVVLTVQDLATLKVPAPFSPLNITRICKVYTC